MKVAYVITRGDSVGGASIHVRDLASAVKDRGDEVRVFIGTRGPVTDQLESRGVPFQLVPSLMRAIRPWRDVRAYGELRKALGAFRPDLVSAHTAKAGWLGRAAAASLGLPAIYTPHGLAVSDRISPAQGKIFRIAERMAARWCQAIVLVSEAERELALQARIAPAERLHVIHNGVRDSPLRADPSAMPVRLISIARFEPPKDFETLFAALQLLREEPWDKLTVIGGGSYAGLPQRVESLGYVPDPAPQLASAQVFVLSSRSEGFPRSILEAMRAGLPVVATDVGGVREAVQHGRSGLLVPAGDAAALASGLQRLIKSAQERQQMGEQGRLLFRERFGAERMIFNTLQLYATIVGVRAS